MRIIRICSKRRQSQSIRCETLTKSLMLRIVCRGYVSKLQAIWKQQCQQLFGERVGSFVWKYRHCVQWRWLTLSAIESLSMLVQTNRWVRVCSHFCSWMKSQIAISAFWWKSLNNFFWKSFSFQGIYFSITHRDFTLLSKMLNLSKILTRLLRLYMSNIMATDPKERNVIWLVK